MYLKKKKGFTIIELVIYTAIVTVVLLVISSFIIDIMSSKSKAMAIQEVNQNGRFIINKISIEARKAKSIVSLASNSMTLSYPSSSNEIFSFDTGNKKITMQIGSNPAVDLSTNDVEITSGSFTDLSSRHSKNVKVSFTVAYKNIGGGNQFDYSKTFETTLELRADE